MKIKLVIFIFLFLISYSIGIKISNEKTKIRLNIDNEEIIKESFKTNEISESDSGNNKNDSKTIYIWPIPKKVLNGDITVYISPDFQFSTNLTTSTTLKKAMDRYYNLIFIEDSNPHSGISILKEIEILIKSDDETLQLGFDESYEIYIDDDGDNGGKIISQTVYGAIRALETLYQMIKFDYEHQYYSIPKCPWIIEDSPRFPHRGVMLDTSRHFYAVDVLKEFIDALAYNKFNVFHWHAVDSQSFPLTSLTFPKMTKGSWSSQEVYSIKDIKSIIQHAKERGIRVELEIDMPGHAYSWGIGYPEVLPANFSQSNQCQQPCPTECNIPLDVSSKESYLLAMGLLREFNQQSMFNETFFHIGGDEVAYPCWNSSLTISHWMKQENLTSFQDAAIFFEIKAIEQLIQLNKTPVMWEDAYLLFGSSGITEKLPLEVIVQIYHNPLLAVNTTKDGYKTLQSPYWPYYLDNPSVDWEIVYAFEPSTGINKKHQHLLLGGETCMWSELVDPSNLFAKVYPRASATSERLWSTIENSNSTTSAKPRLERFRCSLLSRGIGAAPLNSTSPQNPNSCIFLATSIEIKKSFRSSIKNTIRNPPIWPAPLYSEFGNNSIIISNEFNFTIISESTLLLNKTLSKYYNLIFIQDNFINSSSITLNELKINLKSKNETLKLGFDESYVLNITKGGIGNLEANTVYGIMRGLETFYQLIKFNFQDNSFYIENCLPLTIIDEPRFPHRGILLDTSRHFYSVDFILRIIDSLGYHKFNVLHWHVIDSQSFPLQSKSYPNLTNGAWSNREIYSYHDIKRIIKHGKENGIRIQLEIDMPGHAKSWSVGYPDLMPNGWNDPLANCPDYDVPLDPSSPLSLQIASALLTEFSGDDYNIEYTDDHHYYEDKNITFDNLFHIGGDEVEYQCWNNSNRIKQWMKENNLNDFESVAKQFEIIIINKLLEIGKIPVMWEDAFKLFYTDLPKDVVVEIYHDQTTAINATNNGYRIILSIARYWYLEYSYSNWENAYGYEPTLDLSQSNIHLVLGGEGAIWSESIDPSNVFQKLYPTSSAIAERLWSPIGNTDLSNARLRLESFRCSLLKRGIHAAPLNSSYPLSPNSCYQS
ncbi:hypothetical protein RB653_008185 [Dictyostelium firmibasis]|uniref:beta-N-acetylhexosaminidase n=1 Tax=Dictyostelium firmibasis TaxID=79012 RepID=A0AAN7TZP3_9MYCE